MHVCVLIIFRYYIYTVYTHYTIHIIYIYILYIYGLLDLQIHLQIIPMISQFRCIYMYNVLLGNTVDFLRHGTTLPP